MLIYAKHEIKKSPHNHILEVDIRTQQAVITEIEVIVQLSKCTVQIVFKSDFTQQGYV